MVGLVSMEACPFLKKNRGMDGWQGRREVGEVEKRGETVVGMQKT